MWMKPQTSKLILISDSIPALMVIMMRKEHTMTDYMPIQMQSWYQTYVKMVRLYF